VICSSGIGFDPVLDGKRLTFGFEGIYQGTAVLYDRETGSLWMHLTGACFEGELAGRVLGRQGTGRHTTWEDWWETHPDTDVMAPDPKRVGVPPDRGYFDRESARSGSPYMPPMFPTTIHDRDRRLASHDLVYGALFPTGPRAWPLAALLGRPVVEEEVGGIPVTLWSDAASRSVGAFDRRQGDRRLTFLEAGGARRRDRETGSLWNLDGECVEGTLAGTRLESLRGLLAEWYGWYANHPDTSLWAPP